MSDPYFPFFPNNWLGSQKLKLMTPAERGMFIQLLAIEWNSSDCGLPADPKELSKLADGIVTPAVQSCFFEKDGRLFNKKLLDLRGKVDEISQKRQKASQSRWNSNGKHLESKSNASAMYTKTKTKTKTNTSTKPESKVVSGSKISQVEVKFQERWNRLGSPFPKIKSFTSSRRSHLKQRASEDYWMGNWRQAMEIMKLSEFCRGGNDRGWVADPDFFLRPDSLTKLLEGKYANDKRAFESAFTKAYATISLEDESLDGPAPDYVSMANPKEIDPVSKTDLKREEQTLGGF